MSTGGRIEIVEPRAVWAADFETLKTAVLRLAPLESYLHHIGSTAVPGLAAKDVIDMQLTVPDLDAVRDADFLAAGFRFVPGLADHCPAGLDLPELDLRKRFFRATGRSAHLHVRERGRFNQRFALLCRDYLRTHPVTAAAYSLIKRRLASRDPGDQLAYYEIKDPVFDIIVEGANEWAARTGWIEPPGD